MVNLEIPAYVVSKVQVLAVFDGLQCGLLLWMVTYWVGLPGSKLFLFLSLWLGSLAGTMLGLCISAMVGSSDQAVGMVPIAMIPQIIFTKMILPGGSAHGGAEWLERLIPLSWTLELYERVADFAREPAWQASLKDAGVLGLFAAGLFCGAMLILWMQE
jgi:hypothetical protein